MTFGTLWFDSYTHILQGQSPFNIPMAISAISTVSLTETYEMKFCHSFPMHQVALLITDMHSTTQSLPKTSCRYEAVERYPRFGQYWNLDPSDSKVSQGSSITPFQEIFRVHGGHIQQEGDLTVFLKGYTIYNSGSRDGPSVEVTAKRRKL